ncbi:cysteine desulfurase family protein [Dolosicoccus paucivorans]
MIYLDYAATTPMNKNVIHAMIQAMETYYGNPSSVHQEGKVARHELLKARQAIAAALKISRDHLYFTSGATEANNWALVSQAHQARSLNKGNHIISSSIEHPSVIETLEALKEEGFEITYIDPDPKTLQINVEDYLNNTMDRTIGWVAMAVNSEVGAILPVQELGQKARELNLWFHVDFVQALGKTALTVDEIACTSLSLSAHKIFGPKGMGLLYYHPFDERMILQPFIHGGGQERGMRSGTENTPGIIGFAKAIEEVANHPIAPALEKIHNYLLDRLKQANLRYEMNGPSTPKAPHIVSIWLKGISAERALIQLDLKGLAVSAGSACSAGTVQDSPILKAYYPKESERWHESLRLSFGPQTTTQEIDALIEALEQLK